MNELSGNLGELRFTVTIKRAATGKEETFDMIGTPIQEKEKEDGSNALDSSQERSD